MSKSVSERIARHEGFRSHVYLDSKGFLSIGYGTTVGRIVRSGPKNRPLPSPTAGLIFLPEGVGVTEIQARGLLEDRIIRISFELSRKTRNLQDKSIIAGLNLERKDVVIEMSYQLGVRGCLNFKRMWIALAKENYETAADEMLDSVWAQASPPRGTPERAEELAGIMRAGTAEEVSL